MKRLKNKKDDLVRAWWEEEQAKGETADEGFHLKSSTEGHLAFSQPREFYFLIHFILNLSKAGSRRGSEISLQQSSNFFLVTFSSTFRHF